MIDLCNGCVHDFTPTCIDCIDGSCFEPCKALTCTWITDPKQGKTKTDCNVDIDRFVFCPCCGKRIVHQEAQG